MSVSGKLICFTGTLTMKRADATAKATAAGAKIGGSVTGKTDILVAGPGAGVKVADAKAKGVDVWTEAEFMSAVGGDDEEEEEEEAPAPKKGKAAAKRKATEEPAAAAPKAAAAKCAKKGKAAAAPALAPAPAAAPSGVTIAVDAPAKAQCPSGIVHGDFAYLGNQVDISGGNNNNKFYRGQVLVAGGRYYSWTRWGRVGEPGQSSLAGPSDLGTAVKGFEKKFKDKTGHAWAGNAADYPSKGKGKYTVIHEAHGAASQADKLAAAAASPGGGGGAAAAEAAPVVHAPPTITGKLAAFVGLVTDADMFKEQLASMGVDTTKMPLGDISKKTVDDGFRALLEVEAHLKSARGSQQRLAELCSVFYTYIPHSFGRQKAPLLTLADIEPKKDMLNVLADVGAAISEQAAAKTLGRARGKKGAKKAAVETVPAVIDTKYESLGSELRPVDPKSAEFKMVKTYSDNTQGHRKCAVEEVFAIDGRAAGDGFDAHAELTNRRLLWHGTNVAVVAAILKSGLRIMPHSGGRVGSGIYLASENGKSAGYVGTHGHVGIMFLCEAALGKQRLVNVDGQVNWNEKDPISKHGADSVLAVGCTEPDPAADVTHEFDGRTVAVPQGKVKPNAKLADVSGQMSSFAQSEYLIYKESQCRIRYVLKMKF